MFPCQDVTSLGWKLLPKHSFALEEYAKCISSTRKFNKTAEAKDSIHDETSAVSSIGRRGNIEQWTTAGRPCSPLQLMTLPPPPGGKHYVQPWKPCSSKCMKELASSRTRAHDVSFIGTGGRVCNFILAMMKAESLACTINSTPGRVVASVRVKAWIKVAVKQSSWRLMGQVRTACYPKRSSRVWTKGYTAFFDGQTWG